MGFFKQSIAEEDVQFSTQIVKEQVVGENYGRLVIYIENSRFVAAADAFVDTGTVGVKKAIVTSSNYRTVVKGALLLWLQQFFVSNTTTSVVLVSFVADMSYADTATGWKDDTDRPLLQAAFDETKEDGYFKTICVDNSNGDTTFDFPCAKAAHDLMEMCASDELLSSAPLLPFYTTPENASSDPLLPVGMEDAILVATEKVMDTQTAKPIVDSCGNNALLQLGLTLSLMNSTGTYVANSSDNIPTTDAVAGYNGTPLTLTQQNILSNRNIGYFKPVGLPDNSVALRGGKTAKGDVISAKWLVDYANFCCKCYVAQVITGMNVTRDADNYSRILAVIQSVIMPFVEFGRLTQYALTAPAFSKLPKSAGDTIIIPSAWVATYVDDLRKVRVTGTLIIG